MQQNTISNPQKVQMIDSNLSFDLELTFQDITANLNCSKQQIARRFQLLIQQKQNLLRKQIQQINANNIKVLHQKTIFFDNVSQTNKTLENELTLKNQQIQNLTNHNKELTSEINQLTQKLVLQEEKFTKFQTHTLQDYKRLQIIQKKYQTLLNEIEEQKNRKNQLQRKVDRINNNTKNWSDRINYLLQNRQKGLKIQYDQEIAKLKDILYFYENDNKSLKEQLLREKKNSILMKQNHFYALNNLQKKYGVEYIPSYQSIQVQTLENSIKRVDVGVEIYTECKQCSKINNLSRHFHNKNIEIQTDQDPRRFTHSESQTFFNFLSKNQELDIINKIRQVLIVSEKQKQHYKMRLDELQKLLDNQPSKIEDLTEIRKLQNKLSQKDKIIERLQNQFAQIKSLNHILHLQIKNLKFQSNQEKQVRLDSLEFKKKNNTLRLFTEDYPTFTSIKTIDNQALSQTLNFQKTFSKTLDMNTTLLNFKTKRSRMSVYTPDIKNKTPKSKTSHSFFSSNQQQFHWKNIEKKLKNPQLFSQSPHVNAVRREKYKKFSLVKKKKDTQKQPSINFTVAF